MKVRVLKEFIDRHTGTFCPVGKELVMTRERFQEILETGPFVEEVKTERKAKVKENG